MDRRSGLFRGTISSTSGRLTDRGCRFGEKAYRLDTLDASRAATAADVDDVTRTIELAFAHDPIWAPALSRPDGAEIDPEPYWRLFVEAHCGSGPHVRAVRNDAWVSAMWRPVGGT